MRGSPLSAAILLLAAGALVAPRAGAADLDWISPGGGTFGEPKNWSFSFVPGLNDLARFGYLDATYSVGIDTITSISAMEAYRGDVTINLLGQTVSLLRDDALAPPSFRVADDAGQSAVAKIAGPGRLNGVDMALARSVGASAHMSLLGGARLSASRTLTIGGEGTARVWVGAGSRVTAQGASLAQGSVLGGSGVVAAPLAWAGAVAPGAEGATGALAIQGNATLAPTAELWIDLAPGASGAQADSVTIAGPASLGGMVRVSALMGHTPQAGDSFTILTASSLTGEFAGVFGEPLTDGLAYTLSYSPTAVTLHVVPAPWAWALAPLVARGRRR